MNPHDGSAAGPRRALVRDREDVVIDRLHHLAESLGGEPDPAFRQATRARLVAMAAVRSPAPEPVSGFRRLLAARVSGASPTRLRTRLTAGLAGAALTVTALATLVAVADDAGPGDVLYGLKRGTEQTQLALAGDSRGQTLLDFAGTRLDELQVLVDEEPTALPAAVPAGPGTQTVLAAGADPALVLETLRDMDDQTRDGAVWLTDRAVETQDGEPLEQLSEWAAEQYTGLAAVAPLVPDAAAEAAGQSLALLTDITTRAEGLRSAVGCPAGPAVTGNDELGPVPGLCVPPPPAATAPDPGAPTGSTPGPVPSAGPDPQAPAPTDPPAAGTTPGEPGSGGLPTTVIPPLPPVPSPGGGLVPSISPLPLPLPLPLPTTEGGVLLDRPVDLPLPVCLPPVATLGNC
ncbi:MAG: hypothetical protein JWR82_473 [Blastococcus sp.]|nr:hypothetical protein [Blastococcus sp.]